jgi:LuxR family maltose regulon positive regulatory protein
LECDPSLPLRAKTRSLDFRVQVALWAGDLDLAKRTAAELTMEAEAHSFYRFLWFTSAKIALKEGHLAKARDLLQKKAEEARAHGWVYGLVASLAYLATALEEHDQALATLCEALELAQSQKLIRSFVEVGNSLVPYLREAARFGIAPEYIGQILTALPDQQSLNPLISGATERLSEREQEVLHLIVAGLSNREIAHHLVISLGTAKTHIHNIYGKLEVRNRAQAIARAREIELY